MGFLRKEHDHSGARTRDPDEPTGRKFSQIKIPEV